MDMPIRKPSVSMQLRSEAESRIDIATAVVDSSLSLGEGVQQLLHKLSSDPEYALEVKKLLHELHVHQVELDVQREEMLVNELRVVEECAFYTELYEDAPIAYFLVDFQGEIIESNGAGAELFGRSRDDLVDGRIDHFLTAESRSALLSLLKKLGEKGSSPIADVAVRVIANSARQWRVVAKASSDKRRAMLVFY